MLSPRDTQALGSADAKANGADQAPHARIAQLALGLSSAADAHDAYHALREFVEAETPMNGLFISSYDAATELRTCAYAFSEGDELDAATFPPMGNTGAPHSRACASGETILTQDFQQTMSGKPRFNVGLDKDPTLPRSSLVVPMKAQGKVLGAMEIQSTLAAAFTEEHVATLELAAHLAAVNIQNLKGREQERMFRDELEARVTERTRQLATKNRELESFSWTVAHDLRAPLRAVQTYAEVLEEDHKDRLDEEGLRVIHVLSASSRRMSQLVDDLLQFAKAAQGPIQRELVDLSALAREILGEAKARDPTREAKLVVEDNLVIEADAALVRVLFVNLVDNAWKYSAKKPATLIRVGMRISEGERVFFVQDEGVGFDAAQADRLFAAFQRLHSTEYEGTGIGLATVRRIVERHEGRIWAEAEPGRGATFLFTLLPKPARPATAPQASIVKLL